MLRSIVAKTIWASQVGAGTFKMAEKGGMQHLVDIASKLSLVSCVGDVQRHSLHTSAARAKVEDRREMLGSMPKRDEGTEGEIAIDIDAGVREFGGMFPDENTPSLLFDGVRFDELPILHVKISKNNTIMTLTDHKGKLHLHRSCGMEGFKNCRKGTNVAAQATGISIGMRAVEKGYKNVRVKVKGLGAGRMSGVKGVTMGGLNVISISDVTFINWNNTPRPRKARKL